MSKTRFISVCVVATMVLAQSCSPDCKEVTIKKPIWKTHYEEYWVEKDTIKEKTVTTDTMVSYSVTKHRTEKSYRKNYHDEVYETKVTHYITIRNNNEQYSNAFCIRITGNEYDEYSKKWKSFERESSYVTISPKNSYTFSVKHSDRWRNEGTYTDEGNVEISVLQRPSTISITRQSISKYKKKYIRRFDEMTFKDTVVSNCECDIDALKAEYKAIQTTFDRLKNEKLIKE